MIMITFHLPDPEHEAPYKNHWISYATLKEHPGVFYYAIQSLVDGDPLKGRWLHGCIGFANSSSAKLNAVTVVDLQDKILELDELPVLEDLLEQATTEQQLVELHLLGPVRKDLEERIAALKRDRESMVYRLTLTVWVAILSPIAVAALALAGGYLFTM